MPNIKKSGCYGCAQAEWDADGCTCKINGLLVGNAARGCAYRIYDEEPQAIADEYEHGFKDGLKSNICEELQPMIAQVLEGISEAIKGLIPRMIDIMEIKANLDANYWIPCSERMPKKDGDYLCISNHEIKILPYRNGEFYCICFDAVLRCCNSSVTHWMPLPEPP